MSELLSKISSYNVFNYLLPGIVFVAISSTWVNYGIEVSGTNIFVAAFVFYFVGLVISRIGSLVVEPLLKWVRFLEFEDYKNFVEASRKDPKIEILSEANNVYRTMCALLISLLVFRLYPLVEHAIPFLQGRGVYVLIGSLLALFLASYRKQTSYVVKRIRANM